MLAACCLLAAVTPFIAGIETAFLAVVPIGCAVWLLARSGWSYATRLVAFIAILGLAFGLLVGLLILVTATSGD
jgi:hypothetical protein